MNVVFLLTNLKKFGFRDGMKWIQSEFVTWDKVQAMVGLRLIETLNIAWGGLLEEQCNTA